MLAFFDIVLYTCNELLAQVIFDIVNVCFLFYPLKRRKFQPILKNKPANALHTRAWLVSIMVSYDLNVSKSARVFVS